MKRRVVGPASRQLGLRGVRTRTILPRRPNKDTDCIIYRDGGVLERHLDRLGLVHVPGSVGQLVSEKLSVYGLRLWRLPRDVQRRARRVVRSGDAGLAGRL